MNNSFTCFVKSKPVKTLMYNLSFFVNTINIRYALQFIPVLNVTNYSVASITLTFNLFNFFYKIHEIRQVDLLLRLSVYSNIEGDNLFSHINYPNLYFAFIADKINLIWQVMPFCLFQDWMWQVILGHQLSGWIFFSFFTDRMSLGKLYLTVYSTIE